jgi:tetraacyldisaccharide 4'-kinase
MRQYWRELKRRGIVWRLSRPQQGPFHKLWYGHHPLAYLLWPFSLLYCAVVFLRRVFLQRFCQRQFSVPIIVVGNLSVGGAGKTPLVIALADVLQKQGLRVGIVSRGYGTRIQDFPYPIKLNDDAQVVGDEPLLLARKTGCPVVIAPKRHLAVQYLLAQHQSQVILSDDGLQHYALGRALNIVVVDGERGFGNGFCLPAGPLREGLHRLAAADFIVVNGEPKAAALPRQLAARTWYKMQLLPGQIQELSSGRRVKPSELQAPIAAVAGIGYPARFFASLAALGLSFKAYPFADHYRFQASDFSMVETTVLITEKDAVKCQAFARDGMYVVPVEAKLPAVFWEALQKRIG